MGDSLVVSGSSDGPAATCALALLRGAAEGALAAALFHFGVGGTLMHMGRKTLSWPAIARQARVAAPQLGAALGIFSVVRCAVEEARGPGGYQFVASGIGGGAAVAVMNTAVPVRREWHVRYYTAVLGSKAPVGLGLVAALSALSGAVVFGGTDTLLQATLGLRIG